MEHEKSKSGSEVSSTDIVTAISEEPTVSEESNGKSSLDEEPTVSEESNGKSSLDEKPTVSEESNGKSSLDEKPTVSEESNGKSSLDEEPSSFTLKFITWNIDGLNREKLRARTEAVCKIIEREQADIVFLQEVIPVTAYYIVKRMSDYDCCFADMESDDDEDVEKADKEDDHKKDDGEENNEDDEDQEDGRNRYFVGTLVKKSTVSIVDDDVIDFSFSEMSRNLLKVNVTYKSLPICLLNSHLESLLDGSEERKNQLKLIFREMREAPASATIIFGGDTNLRERELAQVGGLPVGIEDVWVTCGSQSRSAYTFDMSINDNLKVNWKSKPRCRYDRVYFRHSTPSKLKPTFFGLIGLERLSPSGCFPSDHWGILCQFEKDNFKFKLDEVLSDNDYGAQILQPYWRRKPKHNYRHKHNLLPTLRKKKVMH